MPRVLLVDFVSPGFFHGGHMFPFIRGFLEFRNILVEWLRFGIPVVDVTVDADDGGVQLVGDELDTLLGAAKDLPATHVLFNRKPGKQVLERLAHELGSAISGLMGIDAFHLSRVHNTSSAEMEALTILQPTAESLIEWIRPGCYAPLDPERPEDRLAGFPSPNYAFVPANEAARNMWHPTHVLCGPPCNYLKPLDTSLFFSDRAPALENLPARFGCAFCDTHLPSGPSCGIQVGRHTPPLTLLCQQLDAIARTHPDLVRPLRIKILGAAVAADPVGFARVVTGMNLTPTRFLFEYRADGVTRSADQIREAVRMLEERGHRFDICLLGLESFAGRQLDRFHKGYGPEVNLKAVRLLREISSENPDGFAFAPYRGLSNILYDPWTTLDEVALNLAVARHLNLEAVCGKLLSGRLRLTEGLPLTAAARADGLLIERYDDPFLDTARRHFYPDELPWRFKDARLESLNRLTVRLHAGTTRERDTLIDKVTAWGHETGMSPIDRAITLCKAAAASSEALDPETLLERARAFSRQPKKPTITPKEARRIVESWIPTSRELASLRAGDKPVLRYEARLFEGELDLIEQTLRAEWPSIVIRRQRLERFGARQEDIFAGHDAAEVDEAIALAEVRDEGSDCERAIHARARLGVLLGYPECCARAYAESSTRQTAGGEPWLFLRRRLDAPGPVDPELSPLLTKYVPCTLHCTETARLARRVKTQRPFFPFESGRPGLTLVFFDDAATRVHLEALSDLQEVWAPSTTFSTYRLAYGELTWEGDGFEWAERLRRGEAVEIEPGLIRILRDQKTVDWLAFEAFPWWHEKVLHPAFWRECLLAREQADTRPEAYRTAESTSPADDPVERRTAKPAPAPEISRPDPHAKVRHALLATLEHILTSMATQQPQPLHGFRMESLKARSGPGWGELRVALRRGETLLRAAIRPRGTIDSPFAATRRFILTYDSETPPRTEEEQYMLKRLVQAMETTVPVGAVSSSPQQV